MSPRPTSIPKSTRTWKFLPLVTTIRQQHSGIIKNTGNHDKMNLDGPLNFAPTYPPISEKIAPSLSEISLLLAILHSSYKMDLRYTMGMGGRN